MSAEYFSDRERGSRPRVNEHISVEAWGGIVAVVSALIANGAFGSEFPEECPDGLGTSGTDQHKMSLASRAEIPELEWPLVQATTPPTLAILDFVEFCHRAVAKPTRGSFHSFFQHYHLDFDHEKGQVQFRESINRIFSRSGLVFELQEDGKVIRLAPPILRESLASCEFNTGDGQLDTMLESARGKYLDPSPSIRREALEKLWDAWERIKTIERGKDKKTSVRILLDLAASEPQFRELPEKESRELTDIGNAFQIRHSETSQVRIQEILHVDYLFHRLFAMIQLLLEVKR